jgi:hypothetical protein
LAALGAGAALLLSACAEVPGPAPPTQDVKASARADPARSSVTAKLAATAPAAGRAPELIGLTRAELARLLGAPTLLRREPPAEVWQYAGAACVLHVFIYQEPGGGRVTYYEAAQRSGRSVPARDCYDRLVARRRAES